VPEDPRQCRLPASRRSQPLGDAVTELEQRLEAEPARRSTF
jgi:hypothetical protein